MKRYTFFPDIFFGSLYKEDPKGEWVKFWEVVEKDTELQEINKELLEALEDLYHLIDSAHDGERVFTTEMQQKAKAAIAKAKGDDND